MPAYMNSPMGVGYPVPYHPMMTPLPIMPPYNPMPYYDQVLQPGPPHSRKGKELSKTSRQTKPVNPLAAQRPSKVTKPSAHSQSHVSCTPPAPQSLSKARARAAHLGLKTKTSNLSVEELGRKPSPPEWSELAKPPLPPSISDLLKMNKNVGWQIKVARHLAYTGVHGPYEVGDFQCEIHAGTGEVIKVGVRNFDEGQGYNWRSMCNPRFRLPERDYNEPLCGRPVKEIGDAFGGFWGKRAYVAPPTFVPSADRNAQFMGTVEEKSALKPGCDPMWS